MVLDTGANASLFYPSFRNRLRKDGIARLERKQDQMGGVGGTVTDLVTQSDESTLLDLP
jgi:hypothetical protein